MDPRNDAFDGEDHDDDIPHIENDEFMENVGAPKKVTGRGPSRPVKSSTLMILQYNEFGVPVGEWKAAYGRHIGQCALRVDINVSTWKKVDQSIKDKMWDETKKMFHIDDPDGKRKAKFEQSLGACCRNFRTQLKSRFIDKKKAPKKENSNAGQKPWEIYTGYITQERWETFEAHVASKEFKKKSEVGRKCSEGNIHHYTLGQKSHSSKKVGLEKKKRVPAPSESSTTHVSVVNPTVQNQGLLWCLTHQTKTKDGKWKVNTKKADTASVVSKLHLEKETEDGATSAISTPDNDALAKAMDKKDYDGYVKTFGSAGVGVNHRAAFEKVNQRGVFDATEAKIQSLEETVEVLKSQIDHIYAILRSQGRLIKPYVDVEAVSIIRTTHEKNAPDLSVCKCRLTVNDDDGNLMVVADGTYHPTSTGVIHSRSMMLDHFRVSINMPYDEHVNVKLPMPTDDGVTILGDAKGYFVSWPTSMVLFEERQERRLSTPSMESKGSCDPMTTTLLEEAGRCSYQVEDESRSFPPQCEMLQTFIIDKKVDAIIVPFRKPLLYLNEDKDVWITADDVNELLGLDCISAPVILVYIRYLVEQYPTVCNSRLVTFLCPQRISAIECQRSKADVALYLRKAFLTEAARNESHAQLILAPYNESNHWILLGIDLKAGKILLFDPLNPKPARRCAIFAPLKSAYNIYKAIMKDVENVRLTCIPMRCAVQPGSTECGYYVMKYMHEIVSEIAAYSAASNVKMFIHKLSSYSEYELNEIREQWAEYFRENLILS